VLDDFPVVSTVVAAKTCINHIGDLILARYVVFAYAEQETYKVIDTLFECVHFSLHLLSVFQALTRRTWFVVILGSSVVIYGRDAAFISSITAF
jgi:hypothetical protein